MPISARFGRDRGLIGFVKTRQKVMNFLPAQLMIIEKLDFHLLRKHEKMKRRDRFDPAVQRSQTKRA
jgi:hypothetical protein